MMGIEKGAFAALVMIASFFLVAKAYWALPAVGLGYAVARWLSKKDDQFVAVLLVYLQQEHVYDAVPRLADAARRPQGFGKGLPR